jgi:Ca2+-binding RTX toxin-like protein
MFESLESRQFLSAAPLNAPDATLQIDGTDMADQISIFRTSDDYLIIEHVAGHIDPKTGEFIPAVSIDRRPVLAERVKEIVLTGGRGDDFLDVSAAGIRALLDGGAGDDVLIGSTEADALIGGEGDDTLYGNAGDDALSGGDGKDALFGQAGRDALFGGRGNDLLVGADERDTDGDLYDGGAGSDRAVIRTAPFALENVEKILPPA